ncbi:OX2G protein, partial [Amia calva]|nr:OX2G protein [Amia calva]
MYADKSIESVATYSKRFGAKVLSPYQDRINFTKSDLNTSSITIQNVRFEDAAIYICSFNAYPEGSTRGQLSLSVYGISEVTAVTHHVPSVGTSSQKVVVICAATGLPAPQVKWSSTAGAVLTGQERVQRVNGIYTVTSNLTVDTSELADKYVDCVVSNSDLKEPISQRVSLEQMARTTPERKCLHLCSRKLRGVFRFDDDFQNNISRPISFTAVHQYFTKLSNMYIN